MDDLIPLQRVPQLHTWTTNSKQVFQKMTENVTVYLGQAVTSVRRVTDNEIYVTDSRGITEKYNSIVFACPADSVVKILQSPSLLEYILLYWVSYTDDTDKSFLEGVVHHDVTVLPEEHRGNLLETYANYIELNHRKDGTISIENTFILSSWVPAATTARKKQNSEKTAMSTSGKNQKSEKTTTRKNQKSGKTAMSTSGKTQNSEKSTRMSTSGKKPKIWKNRDVHTNHHRKKPKFRKNGDVHIGKNPKFRKNGNVSDLQYEKSDKGYSRYCEKHKGTSKFKYDESDNSGIIVKVCPGV